MGEEITSSRFRKKDFSAFECKLREETARLGDWFGDKRFVDQHPRGGFELEAWIVDQECLPAPVNQVFLEEAKDLLVATELSKFNIEINGHPQTLSGHGLKTMQKELSATWQRSMQIAESLHSRLIMIGILPTVREQDLTLENMSGLERYRALNEQILRLRKGRPMRFNIEGRQSLHTTHQDVMLEAAATSFQIHLQTKYSDAVRVYNAAQIVSAPMVAVSANSPYLLGKDLWDESRIPLFEQAVALEGYSEPPCHSPKRVTFGAGYIRSSLFECFSENLACYPVLLPAQLEEDEDTLPHVRLHNGTIWRWNRPLIGFDGNGRPHLRLEHRVVSAGPTIVDSIANCAFFNGLVYALGRQQDPPESRLPFARARENFYLAAKDGLQANIFWTGGKQVSLASLIEQELLPLARQGLRDMGIDQADIDLYSGIIEQRVRKRFNGAAWQRAYIAKHHCDLQTMTHAYFEQQQKGAPVHQWVI